MTKILNIVRLFNIIFIVGLLLYDNSILCLNNFGRAWLVITFIESFIFTLFFLYYFHTKDLLVLRDKNGKMLRSGDIIKMDDDFAKITLKDRRFFMITNSGPIDNVRPIDLTGAIKVGRYPRDEKLLECD